MRKNCLTYQLRFILPPRVHARRGERREGFRHTKRALFGPVGSLERFTPIPVGKGPNLHVKLWPEISSHRFASKLWPQMFGHSFETKAVAVNS